MRRQTLNAAAPQNTTEQPKGSIAASLVIINFLPAPCLGRRTLRMRPSVSVMWRGQAAQLVQSPPVCGCDVLDVL